MSAKYRINLIYRLIWNNTEISIPTFEPLFDILKYSYMYIIPHWADWQLGTQILDTYTLIERRDALRIHLNNYSEQKFYLT